MGVLIPYTNTNLEPDMSSMAPSGVSIHVTRIGGYTVDGVPGYDEMRTMGRASLDDAVALLSGTRPDLVLYGCTSATASLGVEGDLRFGQKLAADMKCPALTTSGSILQSLERLGVRNVSLMTPYDKELTAAAAKFVESAGFRVLSSICPDASLRSLEQGRLEPDQIIELTVKGLHDQAEAIVLTCTDLRAVECIERLEELTGLPVVTSNQALFHEGLLHLGLPTVSVPGRLARLNQKRKTRGSAIETGSAPYEGEITR